MTESARLVITVDSTQAKSAETDLLRMANASGEAQRATSQVEAAAKSAAVGLGSFRDAQGRITDGSGKLVTDLRKAEAGLDDMSSAVKKLSSSADTLKFQSLNDSVSRVTSSIDPFKSAVEENAKKLLEAADGSNVFEEALGSLGEKASATGTLIKAALSFAGAAGIQGIIAQADAYGQMSDRLKMASDGTEEYSMVQSRLLESANRTYRPLEEAQELYIRTADSLRSMGAETKDVLDITDSFSYLMVTNAASADSASSAISAYSKAIQTGKVDSDGWQSILAATPTIVNSIAESTGKTTAEIRKLGIEGKLSVTDLNESLRKTAEANGLLADSMSTAVSDAMTKLSNSTKVYIGTSNESLGATDKLAAGIGFVADNIDVMASVIAGTAVGAMTLYTAKAGLSVAASIAGRAGNIALAQSAVEVAVANQLAARSATALAASNLAGATTSAAQTEMSAVLAASRIAEAQATGGVIAAQAGLRTASLGVLGVLGGPVGIAVLAGAAAASYLLFRDGADAATSALIDQNGTLDDSIQKFRELSVEQQRFQSAKWAEAQESALDSASSALAEYATRGSQAFNSLGMSGVESAEAFSVMVAEVKAGTRTLDSVTEWVAKNNQIMPAFKSMLEQTAAAYSANGEKAEKYGKLLAQSSGVTTSATTETEKLAAAQKAAAESSGAKAGEWDKYIAKLTETRDLIGANSAAEAEYNAVKMGASVEQRTQAKLIGEQTVVLKALQEAVKDGDKVEQAALKTKLLGLYTAEEAATKAAATQKQAYADTATAAEESAKRQAAAFMAVAAASYAPVMANPNPKKLSGYGLLTNGGTSPAVVPEVPETALERYERAIKLINEGTEVNKKTDKAVNAAAKAIENQAKALKDFEAQSAISTKSSNDMADAYLAGADSVRELAIQQKIEEELLKTGAGARDAVTAAVNREADAKDRLDITQSIASMRTETTQTLAQATATLQGKDALEAFNIQKSMTVALAGRNIEVGSKEYQLLLDQTKAQLDANKALEQAGQVEGIVDRLNPQIKLLKDFTAEQEALNAAIARYPENAALYQDALAKLGNEYEVNRSKATLWGQMTEGAIDRIDEAFATAWGNIGSGAESLWDNLKKGFKQTLGEIAHMLTTKPLLASISNWLTGTDNGQGLGSVWSKLLGSASNSGGSSGGGMFSGMLGIGKNLMSAWNTITGVGSSVASGYASGGISGAISGGAGYYGNMLSNIASTLSSGFTTLIGGNIAITGATAAGTAATTAALTGVTAAQAAAAAATVGAEGVTAAMLSGAVAEGAASIGTNIGIAGATTAAASNGIGAAISSAMSSAAAMWPLAIVMGMYQSGKLYSAGVRPDASEMWDSAGSTALGKAAMLPQTVGAKYFEVTDNILGKVVGGKMAAILSGSTLFQAVWSKVGSKLFGSGYKTKDTGIELGVDGGLFDAQQYTKQKKKGGLLSGSSKTRYLHSALDAETQDALGSAYNEKILNSMGLFSALGVELSESVLDGLNMATTRISTQGKTPEAIQEQLDAWFGKLGDSAVAAINAATNSGLQDYNFEALTTFVNNLYSVNAAVESLGVKAVGFNVAGGKAVETMIAVSGGIEALTTGMNDYYSAFTTEMDKSADSLAAARAEFTKFGFTLPGTRDGLKDVVKGLDLTTEIGQNMFSAIVRNAKAAADAYTILEQRESAYRKAFFSEAENTALAIKGTTAELKALGVTLPASRSEYRKMVEEAAKSTTDTGKAMYDTLMNAAAAASTVFDELERRLNQGVTDSFSGVQRSISAQQKAATAAYNATNTSLSDMSATAVKSVTDLSSVSNSLESALKSLRGTSDDAVKTLRAQAQATLQSALATARSGKSLSGFTGLEDALDTVSNNNTDLYGSMEDFARDQGRTANVVAELNAINGKQLTAAEKLQKSLEDQIGVAKAAYDAQMAQFDQQLEFAQAQMDAFNGIDTSVKSVEAAIKALNGSLIASLAAKPATGAGSAMANTAANNATVVDTLYQQLFGRTADAGENKYWADRLGSGNLPYAEIVANMTQYASAADKAAMAAKGHATGGLITGPGTGTSDSILARLSNGEYVMTAEAVRMFGTGMLDQMNAGFIPAFATGGGIGESGPQLEVTGPSRIFNANQAGSGRNGGDSGATAAEVRGLRREIKDNATYTARLTKTIADGIDTLVNSGMQINGTVETRAANA